MALLESKFNRLDALRTHIYDLVMVTILLSTFKRLRNSHR